MRELRKSTTLFIASLIGFLALSGIYTFIFLDLRDRNAAILMMHQDLLEKEHQAKERLELERTIITTDADRQTLQSYFVSGDKAVAFLETLESYGKTAGTAFEIQTVDIINPTTQTTATSQPQGDATDTNQPTTTVKPSNDEHPSLVFTVHALGRFEDIYQLLLLLENAPYEFEFEKVTLHHLDLSKNISPTAKIEEVLPKMANIERINPASILYLWDATFTIKLLTFTPTSQE